MRCVLQASTKCFRRISSWPLCAHGSFRRAKQKKREEGSDLYATLDIYESLVKDTTLVWHTNPLAHFVFFSLPTHASYPNLQVRGVGQSFVQIDKSKKAAMKEAIGAKIKEAERLYLEPTPLPTVCSCCVLFPFSSFLIHIPPQQSSNALTTRTFSRLNTQADEARKAREPSSKQSADYDTISPFYTVPDAASKSASKDDGLYAFVDPHPSVDPKNSASSASEAAAADDTVSAAAKERVRTSLPRFFICSLSQPCFLTSQHFSFPSFLLLKIGKLGVEGVCDLLREMNLTPVHPCLHREPD